MAEPSDIWTGFAKSGNSTVAIDPTTGILTFSLLDANGGRYRESVDCMANTKGKLRFEARMKSGTGRVFVEYGGAYRYCPCKVLTNTEWRFFELDINVFSWPQISTLTYGLECRAGEQGEMEVRTFEVDVPGIFGGSSSPSTLTSGSYKATLSRAGKFTISQDGLSISDGSAERAVQAHGLSSGTTGSFFARWDDGTGGPVSAQGKSRGGAVGVHGAVQGGEDTGVWQGKASNGTDFTPVGAWGTKAATAPLVGGQVPGQIYGDVVLTTGGTARAYYADHLGNVKAASGLTLATNATDGFTMIQKMIGRPTAAPANVPLNCAAAVLNDSGAGELCLYSARTNTWFFFAPTATATPT